MLYVHGGGFRILSKDTHWIMGLAFARRGFLVFNIGYRLAPKHPFPAAIADAVRERSCGCTRMQRASAATRAASCSPGKVPGPIW